MRSNTASFLYSHGNTLLLFRFVDDSENKTDRLSQRLLTTFHNLVLAGGKPVDPAAIALDASLSRTSTLAPSRATTPVASPGGSCSNESIGDSVRCDGGIFPGTIACHIPVVTSADPGANSSSNA